MNNFEIDKLIKKKEQELERLEYYKENRSWLYILIIAFGTFLLVWGIFIATRNIEYTLFGVFLFIISVVLLGIGIPKSIKYFKTHKQVTEGHIIEEIKSDIESLKKEKITNENIKEDNLDKLLKCKQLLDAGTITQEEFDQKKKELFK